jgi:hypothetical protein
MFIDSIFPPGVSESQIEEICSLKSCGHSLGTFFVSTTFQIFECGWPRLGLKGRKMAKKLKKLQYSGDFFKNLSPKVECLTRLIKPKKKKITFNIPYWEV